MAKPAQTQRAMVPMMQRGGMRVVRILGSALFLAVAIAWTGSHPAEAMANYSCTSTHCYADYWWTDSNNGLSGASVLIDIASMGCSGCTSGQFVDNEMWYEQSNDTACESVAGQNPSCWVETGYIAQSSSVNYFWADNRPDGGGFHAHFLNTVPSGDYGTATYFLIESLGEGAFEVYFDSNTLGAQTYYSTDNYMYPYVVTMGQELAGTSGAWASTAYFRSRYAFDNSGQVPLEPSAGNLDDAMPPYLYVSGSDYWTQCC